MVKRKHLSRKKPGLYELFIYRVLKRTLDILLGLLFIIICVPVGCIVYWQIRKREGKPICIRQVHVGKNGKPFTLVQFRTHANTSSVIRAFPPQPLLSGWNKGVPGSVRFTSEMTGIISQSGMFLRKYHLHHIPVLLHVLKGDMSLVGPRPELIEVAAHYNNEQRKRLLVKPGITGLAQLKGHTHQQHEKMIIDDLLYVNKKSIWLDVKIIWFTIIHYPNRYRKKRETILSPVNSQ